MRRLFLLISVLALAGCSARPASVPSGADEAASAERAGEDVLREDRLLIEGTARWERGRNGVLRLTPPDATDRFKSGTAYLLHAFPRDRPPEGFRTDVTFELSGEPGATVGLSMELRDLDDALTGDVGQLLITLMDPGVGNTAELTASTRAPGPATQYEPVGGVTLDARDWRGTHTLTVDYVPGQLTVFLDGEPLVAADVRLDRPSGPVYLGAFAPTPTMGVVLLNWTFLPR
ncbi:MAG: hypothetical protein AAGI52_14530 [Bacteroidota bacterium]